MSGHLLQSSLGIIASQTLGNTAGLATWPTLNTVILNLMILNLMVLDMDEERGVHKLGRFRHRKQDNASADLRTGANGRGKANLIQSVVDAHRDARADMDRLPEKVTQQRKSQKTMGNGAAERRFTPSTIRIQVNPLAVLDSIGKSLNTILRDDEPPRRGEFASLILFQRFQILNFERRHRSYL